MEEARLLASSTALSSVGFETNATDKFERREAKAVSKLFEAAGRRAGTRQ